MSRKHKMVCASLNYMENFLISDSAINGCISISVIASLLCIPIRITSSAKGLEACAIAAENKKYKSIVKKKKMRHKK